MDAAFETVLARYEERAAREEEMQRAGDPRTALAVRDNYLLHVGQDVARILHAMIVGLGSRTIVELGTSYGYSTLFLADAARITGGKVFTLELSADKQEYAREQLAQAGLADHVEWLCGDALELLSGMTGTFDFVLVDIWKELYVPSLELLAPQIANGGVVAADNMLFPELVRADAERYQTAVRAIPGVLSTLLPVGQGIELSTFWRN
ncbi:O-methyltransferase [Croceicoccus bisphenolivorans]|uniref:O-methyltransferase n=1 Tax=Croceicoccus bisphenolivorans TaxID=1783232 RepID=UPI00082A6969|nr:class I SAM-dependent methyltransferase [Croceicoccus bisphenolivorans]